MYIFRIIIVKKATTHNPKVILKTGILRNSPKHSIKKIMTKARKDNRKAETSYFGSWNSQGKLSNLADISITNLDLRA
jgi:hypothetical protein